MLQNRLAKGIEFYNSRRLPWFSGCMNNVGNLLLVFIQATAFVPSASAALLHPCEFISPSPCGTWDKKFTGF
jgi:hypothetical protein